MIIRLNLIKIPEKVIYNSGSTISDPISDSLKKFGNQIGGELFLPEDQNGKYLTGSDYPNGLAFYSTTVASSYNYLRKDKPKCAANKCPLKLYIDQVVNTLHGDKRDQPECKCDPENHLHIFRLPMTYFLIDGLNQQIIEILRTLKKQKVYIHSTNKNQDKMNLADKLIKLSQQKFKDEKYLRSVWNILTDFTNLFISVNILKTMKVSKFWKKQGFLSKILNGKMILINILNSYLVNRTLTKMKFSLNLRKN